MSENHSPSLPDPDEGPDAPQVSPTQLAAIRWFENLERGFARGVVRFMVGTPDRRYSEVWSAWGHKDSFYLGPRSIGGITKISLHGKSMQGTYECRLALNKKRFLSLPGQGLPQPADRTFVSWLRSPAPETGAALLVLVRFPTDYLFGSAPENPHRKLILPFGAAPSGWACEFGFFVSREPTETLEAKMLQIGQPITRTDLDNGESVWMVVRQIEFDPSVLPSTHDFKSAHHQMLDKSAYPEPGTVRENLTALLWNEPEADGTLQVIEVGGVTVRRDS
jgi:hypothetical protein